MALPKAGALVRRTPLYEVHRTQSGPLLKRLIAGGAAAAQRFAEESQRVAPIFHPGVLAILGTGSDEAGPAQLLEPFDGRDLVALPAPPSADALLALLSELASILEHAHQQGLAHGYLGPRSALISADGALKLTDFRLGAELDRAESAGGARGDLGALGQLVGALAKDLSDPELARIVEELARRRFANAQAAADAADHALSRRGLSNRAALLAAWARPQERKAPPQQPTVPRARAVTAHESMDRVPHDSSSTEWSRDEPRTSLDQQAIDGTLAPGTFVDGRYRIEGVIGVGGMGTVYRATQLAVDREVALKTVKSEAEALVGDALYERFEDEAQIVSQLRHPNTLRVFDFGRYEGVVYLVTELLHGQTLEARLSTGPLDARTTVKLLIDAADALAEAHQKNIIHRDIKPLNLFLDRVGDREIIKILDFGLAKLAGLPGHTVAGMVVGSPAYMSPEQALGGDATPRSDLYSLGVTAFEMLAGFPPFEAATPQGLLLKHRHDPPPRFAELQISVPPDLEQLVRELLAKNPAERPPSAEALRDRLRALDAEWSRAVASSGARRPRVPSASGRDPLLGATLGSYRLEELLGSGALSRVYRAVHEVLGREVAIKVLTDTGLRAENNLKRLQREARALAALSHPAAVQVLDFGVAPDSTPYMIMERIQGQNLKSMIDAQGALSPPRAAWITQQICEVLQAAHAMGLVHRDLKPSNVMVLDADRVKVVDFGIAKLIDPSGAETTRLTAQRALLGSPMYMSPEQIESPSTVGPAADLYALGGVLYVLLCGRPPFAGSVAEVLQLQRTTRPQRPPPSQGLEQLAMWLLEKEPRDRPASASAVLDELGRMKLLRASLEAEPELIPSVTVPLRSLPGASSPPPLLTPPPLMTPSGAVVETLRPGGLPSPARLALGALALSAAVAVGLIIGRSGRPEAPPPTPPAPIASEAPPPSPTTVGVVAVASPIEPSPAASSAPPASASPSPTEPPPTASAAARPASSARPSAPLRDLSALRERLDGALARRGLSNADLAALPELSSAVAEARRAIDANAPGAETATNAALVRIEGAKLDARLAKAKLDRVAVLLEGRAASLDEATVKRLEDRYFKLVSQLGSGATDDVVRLAAQLERELR